MNNTQYANSIVLLEERVARHLDNALGAHGSAACGVCKDFDRQRKALAGRAAIAALPSAEREHVMAFNESGYAHDDGCWCVTEGPFSDEALGQRTPEAIAQDARQAADEANIAGWCALCEEPNGCPHGHSDEEWIEANHAMIDARREAIAISEARYHAALVVIANEEGAGRWARAIDLVAKIFGKSENEVLRDAVSL